MQNKRSKNKFVISDFPLMVLSFFFFFHGQTVFFSGRFGVTRMRAGEVLECIATPSSTHTRSKLPRKLTSGSLILRLSLDVTVSHCIQFTFLRFLTPEKALIPSSELPMKLMLLASKWLSPFPHQQLHARVATEF